jgi:hypothetical protein
MATRFYLFIQSTQTQMACSVLGSRSSPEVSVKGLRSLARPLPQISQVNTFSATQQLQRSISPTPYSHNNNHLSARLAGSEKTLGQA